jgi:hypothetical protein
MTQEFPNQYSVEQKSRASIALYEATCKAFAGFLPIGVSQVMVGLIQISADKMEDDVDKYVEENNAFLNKLEEDERENNQVMADLLDKYINDQENLQTVISAMSDDQIITHALGVTQGTAGVNIDESTDFDILNSVPEERRRDIYKQLKTGIINGTYDLSMDEAHDLEKKFPVGSFVASKHSPLYMVIEDSFGRKYGISPDTKEIICENESVFCSPVLNNNNKMFVSSPSLYEGT